MVREWISDKTNDGFYLIPTICVWKKRIVFYDLSEVEIRTMVLIWLRFRLGFRLTKEIQEKI